MTSSGRWAHIQSAFQPHLPAGWWGGITAAIRRNSLEPCVTAWSRAVLPVLHCDGSRTTPLLRQDPETSGSYLSPKLVSVTVTGVPTVTQLVSLQGVEMEPRNPGLIVCTFRKRSPESGQRGQGWEEAVLWLAVKTKRARPAQRWEWDAGVKPASSPTYSYCVPMGATRRPFLSLDHPD